jgi:hypothetical protein
VEDVTLLAAGFVLWHSLGEMYSFPSFCFENSYLRPFALELILIVYFLWRVFLEDLTYS